MDLATLLFIISLSLLFSFGLTAPTIFFANKFSLVDDANKRVHPANTHVGIIPRAGGLPIFLAILLGVIIFIPLNKIIIGILVGGFLIVLMGLLDDYYDLSPILRFFLNILVAIIVVSFGLGVPYISNPFGGVIHLDNIVWSINFFGIHKFYLIANIFSIIWIVAIMNFVNWSKGVDGQLPGFVAISAFFLGVLAYRFTVYNISTENVAILAFIVTGAFLGFLPWNFYPQKIMPGYGGGALGGFLLAVLSILSFGKLGTMMLVLSVPIIDAIYVIIRRLKNKKSPFKGDAGHFHHRLLSLGWGRRRISFFYWTCSAIFGLSAIYLQGIEKVIVLLLVGLGMGIFIYKTSRDK